MESESFIFRQKYIFDTTKVWQQNDGWRSRSVPGNFSTKETVVAPMAIWFLSLLLEGPLVQLFEAERADEMFRVEFTKHGSDAEAYA